MDSDSNGATLLDRPVALASETETNPDYRSVSGLAIVSLLLGIASPLAMVAPLLFAIPLFALGLSLLTLAKIRASDGQLIGRKAALVGLGLAVASLCAAQSRLVMANWLIGERARPVAEQWMTLLLQQQKELAYQLTVAAEQTPSREAIAAAPQLAKAPETAWKTFLNAPVVQKIQTMGGDAQVRFLRTLSSHRERQDRYVVLQRYSVTSLGNGTPPETIVVQLALARRDSWERDDTPGWRVDQYEQVGPTGNEES